jgi:hypothetical protein
MPGLEGLAMPPMGPADPSSAPTPDAGLAADAMSKVREAVNLLELALPGIPLGSEPHKAILDAIQKLSKTAPPSAEVPGVQMTQLAGLQQKAKQSQMLQSLAASMGQGENVPPVQPQM